MKAISLLHGQTCDSMIALVLEFILECGLNDWHCKYGITDFIEVSRLLHVLRIFFAMHIDVGTTYCNLLIFLFELVLCFVFNTNL